MRPDLNRRAFLGTCVAGLAACGGPDPEAESPTESSLIEAAKLAGPLIETHLHLFSVDRERFPLHPDAPYQPEPFGLEAYNAFVEQTGLAHCVIVHPEPYQDDHSYLEYCFENEPSEGFFKGTCLFDTYDEETPDRMAALVESNPGRIKALRIHAMNPPGEEPTAEGPIKNRDLSDPRVLECWKAATELGLAIQMHFLPHHAPEIAALIEKSPETTVILDHLGRAGMGTDEDYEQVVALAEHPKTYMKLSGLPYSSEEGYPFLDAKPIVRQAFEAFGADRMIWGGLGHTADELARNLEMLNQLLDFASDEDKAKIRGLTAESLYGF